MLMAKAKARMPASKTAALPITMAVLMAKNESVRKSIMEPVKIAKPRKATRGKIDRTRKVAAKSYRAG